MNKYNEKQELKRKEREKGKVDEIKVKHTGKRKIKGK